MESDFSGLSLRTQLQLAAGHATTLRDAREFARLEVTRGTVWLTQAGREEDIFLKRGDSIAANQLTRDVVLESVCGNAAVCIVSAAPRTQAWVARAAQWRVSFARALRSLACRLDPQTC